MDRAHLHSVKYLKEQRNVLRKNLTPAEAVLWNNLKNKKFQNRKFRRQHSILNYIVDFYCAEEQLIIELDGKPHFEPGGSERDYERDIKLTALGFKVVRFENYLVMQNLEGVLAKIASYFKQAATDTV